MPKVVRVEVADPNGSAKLHSTPTPRTREWASSRYRGPTRHRRRKTTKLDAVRFRLKTYLAAKKAFRDEGLAANQGVLQLDSTGRTASSVSLAAFS
jgi:hypothetical protein